MKDDTKAINTPLCYGCDYADYDGKGYCYMFPNQPFVIPCAQYTHSDERKESQKEVIVEKVAFEGPNTPDRGYTCRVSYLKAPAGDALVEIFNAGKIVRHFLFPAYKIYNIQVHFSDIVDGEIANNLHRKQRKEGREWDHLKMN